MSRSFSPFWSSNLFSGTTLTGTDRRDILFGFGGNDVLELLGGNDIGFGGFGDDTIRMGDGNDVGFGGAGDDEIDLGSGNDRAYGGRGDDRFILGKGRNTVDGGRGDDVAVAMGGFDDYAISAKGRGFWKTTILTRTDAAGEVIERTKLKRVETVEFDDYTLYLDGTNNAVFARDDAASTDEDSTAQILAADLLTNDEDPDGDALTIVSVDGVSAGGAVVSFDGTIITYDPGALYQSLGTGETATDTFNYTVDDGKGGTDVATVEVTVTGVNDAAEIAGPTTASVQENNSFVAQVTASDVDSEVITFAITGGADAALFEVDGDGNVSFKSAPDFEAPIGGDNTYEVEVSATDDEGAGTSLTIDVTVEDVSEVPVLISEFKPNPTGSDPDTTMVELSGGAGASFEGVLISVESDAGSSVGIVDRVAEVSGTFDADGLLVVEVPDFENPSFTLILLDSFAGAEGDDIDLNNDGVADNTASFGTVLDAIGIADTSGDEANLFAGDFGGTDMTFSGDEPRLVFRDGSRGDLYAINDPDNGEVIASDGTVLSPGDFTADPLAESFGALNPEFKPTVLINEFRPNPAGTDPATTQVELKGTPGTAFAGVLISIESDSGSSAGMVDRVAEISGTFDANGLLTVEIDDLENPSFTLALLDGFSGDTSTDLDLDNDGTADNTGTLGHVFDAIGVPDNTTDEGIIYGVQLGGTDFTFTGDEPRLIFRDGTTNDLYAINDPDNGEVIAVDGTVLSPADFSADPLAETFGAANPSFDPAPPPSTPVRISEFFPNPTGTDPATTQVELSGTPGAAFSGVLISIESDAGSSAGLVDRVAEVFGTFDANGLLVVDIPDLENPSFTLALLDSFTGDTSTDLDLDNDGTADNIATLGTVLDAIGVPDNTTDEGIVYGVQLGGTDIAFSGDEPRLIFRDAATGDLYAVNDPDNGEVISATGASLDPSLFNLDPLTSTIGALNPVLDGTPPPVAIAAPYSFDFETDFFAEGWTAFSVDSDTANTWAPDSFSGNNFAEANAFGGAAPANDWLITPLFDISGLTDPIVSFTNTKGFEDSGLGDPELSFLYSTDYTGEGDPTAATWTELSYNFSTGGFGGAASGEIDLSGLGSDPVYFAFQYESSGTGGGSSSVWQVDDFVLDEAPVVTPPTERTIAEVQGAGAESAFVGDTVTVSGIVVGDFQTGDADGLRDLRGFFLQMETGDGDAATSDGIFIFDPSFATDVNLGDEVTVTGIVSEFFGATQIEANAVTIDTAGKLADVNTLAASVDLDAAPADANNDPDLEAYEGMLVSFAETLTVNETFQLDDFGQIRLTSGDRPTQFTQENAPDVAGFAAYQADIFSDIIVYDDGRTGSDPQPINPDFDLNGDGSVTTADGFGMGDTVTGLTGVLGYSFGDYRVHSIEDGANSFVDAQTRDALPPSMVGEDGTDPDLVVSAFNVLNFFTTLDEGANTAGPGGLDPRGADNIDEYNRQLEKLLSTLEDIDADIFGLVELENEFRTDQNGDGLVAINAIVDGLNGIYGAGTWAAVDPGRDFVDVSDAISVGMIYKTASVSVVGSAEILDDSVVASLPGDYGTGPVFDGPSTNRAPLAATFEYAYPGGAEQFTVAVTHMKSKGGTGSGGDADIDDGAGNFNETRDEGTKALIDWLGTFADEDQLVLGDFNAYKKEDPVETMLAAGYTNLEDVFDPGTDTFVFDGQTGTLDYAFASGAMFGDVTNTGAWNINSNEPDLYDYNLDDGRDPAVFDGTSPVRSSDHDPILVGVTFSDDLLLA